eukprot:3432111-Rhodomonas_salina.1
MLFSAEADFSTSDSMMPTRWSSTLLVCAAEASSSSFRGHDAHSVKPASITRTQHTQAEHTFSDSRDIMLS